MNDESDPGASEQVAEPRKEMSLHAHAMQELDTVEAGISELAEKYRGVVFDVAKPQGMAEAKAARLEVRAPRFLTENIRAEKIGELSKISKAINQRAKAITEQIRAIEDPIHEQIKAEEDRAEAVREAKRQAEAARIAEIESRIAAIRNLPVDNMFSDGATLRTAIDDLAANTLEDFDEIYLPTAQQARDTSLEKLGQLLAKYEELEAGRAELERQQREQSVAAAAEAERAAEQRRLDDEARAATKAVDEAMASIRAIPTQAISESSEQIAERMQALADTAPDADVFGTEGEQYDQAVEAQVEALNQLDTMRLAALGREEQAAENARLSAELAERQARERQEAQERQEAAEREQAARAEEAAQAAAAAQEEAIRTATLEDAATEAVDLLTQLGQGQHITTRKLVSALERGPQA